MGPALWEAGWWSACSHHELELWRGVEAQHVAATMRLVDTLDEQALLEELLENSKPALDPQLRRELDYLAFSPFRYTSPHPSRFRRAGEPGIWYGAESVETTCTELAYWGLVFVMDSDGLRDETLLTSFTVFPADVAGSGPNLMEPPWSANEVLWRGQDYTPCQALADEARTRGAELIRYWSARHAEGRCCAVLEPRCIHVTPKHRSRMQTWTRKVMRAGAIMVHEGSDARIEMEFVPPE